MAHPALAKLEASIHDTTDVYIVQGTDAERYVADLITDIRAHICEPFPVSATVMEPGFPDADPGSTVSGLCIAHDAGYWLVYSPEQDRFYCFWGHNPQTLGAHGVFGSPLGCWSA